MSEEIAEKTGKDQTGTDAASEAATKSRRLKELKSKATDKVVTTRTNLEARRSTSGTIETIFSTLEGDINAGGGVLAGAVAFRIFLFQEPYTFFFITLVGAFGDNLVKSAEGEKPAVGIGGLTARAIHTASDLTGWGRVTALIAGAVAMFLGARAAVKVLWTVHCLLWRIPPRKIPNSSRAAVGFIGLVTISLVLVGLVGAVNAEVRIIGIMVAIVSDLLFGGMWLFASLRLPRAEGAGWTDMVPGALLFAFGTLVLHLVTVYWIGRQLESKSETYGAIGASLSLLLWAYILGRVITASAALNHARWHQTHDDAPPPAPGLTSANSPVG